MITGYQSCQPTGLTNHFNQINQPNKTNHDQ